MKDFLGVFCVLVFVVTLSSAASALLVILIALYVVTSQTLLGPILMITGGVVIPARDKVMLAPNLCRNPECIQTQSFV